MIDKIKYYFEKEIWKKNTKALPKYQSFFLKQLRIIVLALKGFNEDKVQLRASALTFYSLLSFVPVIAMIFGIAKGFGMEEKLNKVLMKRFGSQAEIMEQVIGFAHTLLENTKGGVVAGVGVVVLFWSVFKVMGNIEKSFNAIWGVTNGRSLIKKFTEYLSIVIVAPILLIVASSATIFVATVAREIAVDAGASEHIGKGLFFFLEFLPYLVLWLLFSLLYMVMPNTKVNWKAAVIAGIISGTAFELVEWAYVNFQIGAVKFNAIYGSFAILPLFLVWLQTSWLIVLFGAELSFANQNLEEFRLGEESDQISLMYRKKLSLLVTHYVIMRFCDDRDAPSVNDIKNDLKIPFKLTYSIVNDLTKIGVFSELKGDEYKVPLYQPGIDTSKLTIAYVVEKIEKMGNDDIPVPEVEAYKVIDQFMNEITSNDSNKLLKDIKGYS